MNRKILSLLVLISMLLAMVSSAAASSVSETPESQQSTPTLTTVVVSRVYFTTQDELNNLAARYDILEVNHEQGYALIILSPEQYDVLLQSGYRMEIDENKTKLLNQPHQALPGQGPDTIPGFPCYRTVAETYQTLQDLTNSHPDMASLFNIGSSWDRFHNGYPNGYDIQALRLTNESFGNVASKPTFFLMAEIHAREYVTTEAALRYAEYLINNYNVDPDITWLLDYFRVYIVVLTNPDGRIKAEAGQLWRKNIDNDDGCTDPYSWGTDLNRNNNFHWNGGGSSPYPCDETYRGPSEASEPETQAIENFVSSIFPDQRGPGDTDPAPDDTTGVFITLHSYSQVVLYPWGWTSSPAPNMTDLATLGRKFGFYNAYEVCQSNSGCMYATNGTSDDWSYGTLGIASYTFEMGTTFFESCSSFESTTYPNNLPALLFAFKAARRPYQNPAGPDSSYVSALPAAANPGEPVLLTATADDTHYNGGEPTQNIAEARFSIDNPSWITDTVTYPMSASDGSFNTKVENIEATIDTTGLTAGRHTIFVESKDVNNNWGVPSSTFLYIIEPGVSPVIEGYVREAGSNIPLAADVTAGLFATTTDPATGYYSMTVISGTYDLVAEAANFSPAYAKGVVAENYQTVRQDFSLYPYCSIFTDDVENGNQGWTAQSPWAITAETSHSPTHSWTDSPGGNYSDYRDISLTSQTFDFSGYTGISVNFWHKYVTEQGWDFGYVEYNSGAGWNAVANYDGNQTSWIQEQVLIPGLDGQPNAQIRFHFTSDSNTTADGWHIDDIVINGGGPSCVSDFPPDAEFSSNSPVVLGQPIQFTNLTAGTAPLSYAWDFGDGSGISNEVDPTYTYASTGTYVVSLFAENSFGTDTVTHTVVILPVGITSVVLTQVSEGPILPDLLVDFSADLSPDEAGKPYTYTIDFGDGTVITDTSSLDPILFTHAFTTSGWHTVHILVGNAGMTDPVTDVLDVMVLYRYLLPLTAK